MAVDFHEFHLIHLPRYLREHVGLQAARLAQELSPLAIQIRHTDNAYTYRPLPHSIDVIAGTEASVVIQLSETEWQRMLDDQQAVIERLDLTCCEQAIEQSFLQRWQHVLLLMFNNKGHSV